MNKKKLITIGLIVLAIAVSLYLMDIYFTVGADVEKLSGSWAASASKEKHDFQSSDSLPSDDSYQKGKIPDSIVDISSGYVIVVDKKQQKLYVFQKNGDYFKVFETSCSTGKNSGSKQIAGDAKTPNGIFFATSLLHNPGPPETFGSLAFTLDYPTLSDKRAGKDGNNIWIHGTTKRLLPQQSNGCVVLSDSDIKKLVHFIYLNRTPVIICESINWVPQNHISASREELKNILTAWHKAFVEKDLTRIDSLYVEGAQIKGKKREDLHEKIKNLTFINKHFVLQPRDISVLQEGNNAVIIFDQIFAVNNNNSFQGFYNKLILEKIKNTWRVVDESSTYDTAGQQLASVKDKPKDLPTGEKNVQKDIHHLVNKWRSSWESGQMKTYRSCYASDFQSREMNLDAWILHKSNVRQKSKNIRIGIHKLQISVNGNTARASFVQQYSSSTFNTKGQKTLELKKVGERWKIHREVM